MGTTAILTWALALAPSKDNYWSTDVQTGSSYDDFATIKEPYNRLHSAVSSLSKGPVAPSDKIGCSDVALILRSCMANGRLLAADKPAMLIDAAHVQKAFSGSTTGNASDGATSGAGPDGEVWVTHTHLGDSVFGVAMAAVLQSDYQLSLAKDMGMSGAHVHYEANTSSSVSRSPTIPLKTCGKWDFQLYAVAPVLPNGWALLGEPDKWVPVSNERFRDFSSSGGGGGDGSSSVTTMGVEGETVSVAWLAPNATTPTTVVCTIARGSAVSVRVSIVLGRPEGACVPM